VATAAPECVEWYLKEGRAAVFMPEASDPDIFHPMPDLPKIHDISFVGACYGIRREVVLALRRAGISVTAFGRGWEGGRLSVSRVPKLFAQSRIVLGVGTIGHCRDFCSLKMRDFDAPMSGSLYLAQSNPDLDVLYENRQEIVTYRSVGECVETARYLLEAPAVRESIAKRGWWRAVTSHTWRGRFSGLLDILRGTGSTSPLFPSTVPPTSGVI
jgi:spore maturation protein CgeB